MGAEPIPPRVFELFAVLLEYPVSDLADAARECAALAAAAVPEAAPPLLEVGRWLRRTAPSRLQELYSRTFDLDASCHPYVGHHLFGESHRRSAFMVGLRERYRDAGLRADERELPDHVALILRYLAVSPDEETASELIHLALLPALERMAKPQRDGEAQRAREGGYLALLQALRLVLERCPKAEERSGANA